MILAADIGGSKTLLGYFAVERPRPRLLDVRTVRTLDYDDLPSLIAAALGPIDPRVSVVALGVAGPVVDGQVTMTNVPWRVRTADVVAATGSSTVRLLNDLEAMAYAVPVLTPDELHTLQPGTSDAAGNAAACAGACCRCRRKPAMPTSPRAPTTNSPSCATSVPTWAASTSNA